ncbi:NUDIX domain-containing protein [Dermabacteraceae bacterium P13147]
MRERPSDLIGRRDTVSTELLCRGAIWDVVRDTVNFAPGNTFRRDYIRHTGAVSMCALRREGETWQVLLIKQYRHPAGVTFWELPAGLLDVDGEAPYLSARRELREETGHVSAGEKTLIDLFPSAGSCDEAIRVFVSTDVSYAPDPAYMREGEEAEIIHAWWPVDAVMSAILAGEVQNGVVVAAIPALLAALNQDETLASLRPADAPWPAAPRLRGI